MIPRIDSSPNAAEKLAAIIGAIKEAFPGITHNEQAAIVQSIVRIEIGG